MFIPSKAVFDEKALTYPLGKEILEKLEKEKVNILINKGGRVIGKKGETPIESFVSGKRTLVVGIRKKGEFQTCKPSANYQLPLVSGCSGMCEYCYLNTQLGKRPYTKVYVNIDEILKEALKYVEERGEEITVFEGAATSDPIPTERYTGALKKAIEFFGKNKLTYFRFVTKFSEIDSLIGLNHNGHTRVRFSLNTDKIIKEFERGTDPLEKRIEGCEKLLKNGYEVGFIIAPVFIYDNWQEDYKNLIKKIGEIFNNYDSEIEIEVISHRFTERAKNQILSVYENSKLPMDKEERKLKYGQFGYTKYVYKKEDMDLINEFFKENIKKYIKKGNIKYII